MENATQKQENGNNSSEENTGTKSLKERIFGKRGTGSAKKLIIIEPKAPCSHIYSKLKLPRIGAVLLATIMKRLGWETKVFVEDIAPVDYKEVLTADVVGISSITSTASRAYAMADAVRQYGIPVVMGGPHVTFLVEEALEHCDYVVRGEGEEALPTLLKAIFGEGSLETVPNLSFRAKSGEIISNPQASSITDLDSLPHPDYSLVSGWKTTLGFANRNIIPIQASRGCPFACNFCSVVGMFGRKMRWRSAESIVTEIEAHCAGQKKKQHIFFYDDNFTASPKRAKEIIRLAQSRGLKFTWSSQVRVDVARDEEMLRLMKDTGCVHVYIGFESFDPVALKEMNKSQTVEDMALAAKKLGKYGIDIHGMFVLGFENDTRESIRETIKFAVKSGIESVQFLILTPLPGTPLFRKFREENKLTINDWSLYDAQHVVFKPKNLSAFELQKLQVDGHKEFYSLERAVSNFIMARPSVAAICLYARKLNSDWQKFNETYLKALNLAHKAKTLKVNFDCFFEFEDIKAQVLFAARQLSMA